MSGMILRRLFLLSALLLIAGCGSYTLNPPVAAPQPATPAVPAAAPAAPQQTVTVIPASTPQPAVVPSADGAKLKTMIETADGRLKSYQYFFSDRRPDPNIKFPIIGEFKIKGSKISIFIKPVEELSTRQANLGPSDTSLYQPQLYGNDYYDQFFLNMDTRTAYARCENQLCKQRGMLVSVAYADFYRKTPMDWRKEIPLDTVQIIDSKQIQGQSITRVSYTAADGTPIIQWLEQYSMLPVRVDVGDEETGHTIHFTNLAPNSVSDREFEGVAI